MISDEQIYQLWRDAEKLLREGERGAAVGKLKMIHDAKHDLSDFVLVEIGNVYDQMGQHEDARHYYERSIDVLNEPLARIGLAKQLVSGAFGQNRALEAFYLVKEAEGMREPAIYLFLGRLYKFGIGVDKDLDKATHYYLRAYRYGNLMALRAIAHVLKEKSQYCRALTLEMKATRKIWPIWRKNPDDWRLRLG